MSYDKFRNITLQQLEGLAALVEAGSFTRAAENLRISQPALTKQMINMEESVGGKLLNRSSSGIYLTPEGQLLYNYAKRVIRLREDVKDRLERLQNQESGHIYVAASNIPATYILPHLLIRLREVQKDIQVHMQMYDSEEALQTVLNNQAEIGFIGKETADRKLAVEPLWKDKLVLALPAVSALETEQPVGIEDLVKLPFVVRQRGSGTRQIADDSLQKNFGMNLSQFNIVCELGSSEAVKEAVLSGLGVSILSSYAVRREAAQGLLKIAEIRDCPMDRFFYLIYRKNFSLRKHHLRFLDIARTFHVFP